MNRKERRQAARGARAERRAGSSPPAPERALAAAAEHRTAGRLHRAAALYRRVLKARPDEPEALHWLGVLEHLQGRHEAALALLEQAAAQGPADPLRLHHLAEVRRILGRQAEAVEDYRAALSLAPGVADIHYGLGTALFDLNRMEEAAVALRRALDLSPDDPEAHNNLANALAELGQAAKAEAHYRRALALRPDYAEARMNLGSLMAQTGRDEEAEACYRAAVVDDPGLPEAHLQLARHLRRMDRIDKAGAVLRRAVELHPDHAEAHNELGRCLVELGRPEEALERYRSATELKPDLAEASFNMGVCLQSLGRFDEAVAAHERALALRPDLAEARYNLSLIESERPRSGEVTRLEALLEGTDLADEARINTQFALGRIYENWGDAATAFDHYRRGNDLKAARVAFDAERHVAYVDRLIATFDADFFAVRSGWGAGSGLPVFVLGMPRSGTTLVEQILASHPAVFGAGELDDFRRMVSQLPGRLESAAPFPDCAGEITRDTAAALAEEYLHGLRRRAPDARRVTDKMTGNYLRLGLVALLLPGAKIIHCRRDPVDTCLSCYFQNFAKGLSFTYDLEHLGLVYRQYERLMAHWEKVLPLPMLELRYEQLIEEQEAVSRRIVAFCDLPWDARCLAFHQGGARHVRTASFWQVRQPLYGTSVGRWRAFAEHLGPLYEALGLANPTGA